MNPTPRVTIREVAAAAQVSVATVRRVLNRRYCVANATSERVNRHRELGRNRRLEPEVDTELMATVG